jgi:hypothetical protein
MHRSTITGKEDVPARRINIAKRTGDDAKPVQPDEKKRAAHDAARFLFVARAPQKRVKKSRPRT